MSIKEDIEALEKALEQFPKSKTGWIAWDANAADSLAQTIHPMVYRRLLDALKDARKAAWGGA